MKRVVVILLTSTWLMVSMCWCSPVSDYGSRSPYYRYEEPRGLTHHHYHHNDPNQRYRYYEPQVAHYGYQRPVSQYGYQNYQPIYHQQVGRYPRPSYAPAHGYYEEDPYLHVHKEELARSTLLLGAGIVKGVLLTALINNGNNGINLG